MQGAIDAGAAAQPPDNRLGLHLALVWLTVGSLACVASLPLVFTPEVLVNVSIITVPVFVSGWGGVIAAMRTRRRPMPNVWVAPLVGAGVGLVVGGVGLTLAYFTLWPPSF